MENRPAFMVLGYPVVSMDATITHQGSRNSLLGDTPDDTLVKHYSNELHVTKKTPPTFIVHAQDDVSVPLANSQGLVNALEENSVPSKLVVYEQGGHGFGMRKRGIPIDNWTEELKKWMEEMHLL
jgi:dipeptidyl aminopeptidase/acylaminoacyl peptidase